MARFGDFDQYLDNAGDPLAEGKLYFYESGTTTPKTTYADINNSIPNTNPVLLSAAGRQPNIFFDGVAKVILTDNDDVQIAVRDPAGETGTDFGDEWVATKIYNAVDVVLGSDGIYYRSLINGNQNNNPVTTSGSWTLLYSVEWNAGITYSTGDVVTYGSQQYQSLQDSNLNQNPSTQAAYWVGLSFAWLATATYSEDQNAVGTDGILYTSLQNSNTGNDPATSPAYWVGTSAAAAASAVAAAASAAAALVSENAAAADAIATAADRVQTGLDAAATAADAIATAADRVQTGLDAAATAADVILTNADAVATAADRVQTGLDAAATSADAIATAADRVQTGLDVIATNADASSTAADAIATAADRVQTGLDVVATSADVVQTGLDVTAAAGSASAASGSASAAAGSAVSAAASYDAFDDRYLGEKASDPTLDNDGNALITGALYFNTSTDAMKVYTGSVWQDVAPVATTVTLSQVTDFPSQSGQSGKYLSTNGTVPNWATLTTDPTLGTLTKTFTSGESSTINLTSSVLAPVVSVTKEVPQSGVTNNNWDVNSTTENYTRLDSAYATTLDWAGFDVSTASFVDSFSVAGQETSPSGIAFNTDGTKMFIVGETGDDVNEYSLSTGFDVSTASFTDSFDVSGQDTAPNGIAFNVDGTKMFIVGNTGDDVNEYSLSTGFDVSTASFVDSFSVSSQETTPRAISFNIAGTKMFILGQAAGDVHEYTLSTGFDVSTASFVDSFSVAAQETAPRGLAFSADGTKMFVTGSNDDDVNEYTLSTGFDVSTASFVDSFSVAGQETSPTGIAFNASGTKMFIVGNNGDDVNEYTIAATLALGTGSFASADVGKTIEANSGVFVLTATDGSIVETTAPTSYAQVASGSWEMYGVVYNTVDGDLELSNLNDVYNLSAAALESSIDTVDNTPNDLFFKTDGTVLYVLGRGSDVIRQKTLSTAWDITTAGSATNYSFAFSDAQGLFIRDDGLKFFIIRNADNLIRRYSMSTAWNITTGSFDSNTFNVGTQDGDPLGVFFKSDGSKFWVVGNTTNTVYQYSMSTAWDLGTASYDSKSLNVGTEAATPTGIFFKSDGTELYLTDDSSNKIYKYSLTTAWDISTASYSNVSFGVTAGVQGIYLRDGGLNFYTVDSSTDKVYQYSMGAGFYFLSGGYHPVHTTQSIDSTYWTDINSMTADQAAGDGNVYYAISTDDRTTWTVIDNTDGERDIVRNNAGTWQYNSNGTYASETWVNGATNTELATLAEAMEGAAASVPYDLANSTQVTFTSAPSVGGLEAFILSVDGTRGYFLTSSDIVYQSDLPSAFTGSGGSWGSLTNFSVTSQETSPRGIRFKSDGTKMYILGYASDAIHQYSLSTAWDVTSASYDSVSFSVSSQSTTPAGLSFSENGLYVYITDVNTKVVYQYNLSTAWDISSASYSNNSINLSSPGGLTSVDVVDNGTKMFASFTGLIQEYSLSSAYDVSTATATSDSISSLGFNSPSIQILDSGGYMALVNGNDGYLRDINVTTSYTNQMDKTQLDAVTDPNHIALGDDLDLAIIFNMTSGATVPSSDGVAINYDANVLNKGAVLGTDYDFDAPTTSSVRINALAANNLKVRVV
jgi:hypothetical protein